MYLLMFQLDTDHIMDWLMGSLMDSLIGHLTDNMYNLMELPMEHLMEKLIHLMGLGINPLISLLTKAS